jgi:hypothetical protein
MCHYLPQKVSADVFTASEQHGSRKWTRAARAVRCLPQPISAAGPAYDCPAARRTTARTAVRPHASGLPSTTAARRHTRNRLLPHDGKPRTTASTVPDGTPQHRPALDCPTCLKPPHARLRDGAPAPPHRRHTRNRLPIRVMASRDRLPSTATRRRARGYHIHGCAMVHPDRLPFTVSDGMPQHRPVPRLPNSSEPPNTAARRRARTTHPCLNDSATGRWPGFTCFAQADASGERHVFMPTD